MSSQHFKELCRESLDKKDLELLEMCSLDPDPSGNNPDGISYGNALPDVSSRFINSWRRYERALRLNLARFRSQQLKRENRAPVDPPQEPMDAAVTAKAALTMDSPMEAEIYLDKARWSAIESLEGADHFSSNTIFSYLLKLYLMERHSLFKAEEGFAEYKSLYASIINQASGGEAISTSNLSGEPK